MARREGKPAVLFVHGSSMASQPTFDLTVPGRPDSSVMDWFARRGFVCWCVDMEGYGRSDKTRDIYCDIANGADDLAAATDYIAQARGIRSFLAYGISSGALARGAVRAAASGPRRAARARRLRVDRRRRAHARAAAQEAPRIPGDQAAADRPRVRLSIFARDHPDCAEPRVVEAFADAILALDDSMPNGTYIDMCSKLPVVDPAKIPVPTIVLRGQYDGIAAFDDLIEFWKRLPNPDKQFTVMAGISHASFQQKNYLMVYHILHAFFTQPAPAYAGEVGSDSQKLKRHRDTQQKHMRWESSASCWASRRIAGPVGSQERR